LAKKGAAASQKKNYIGLEENFNWVKKIYYEGNLYKLLILFHKNPLKVYLA